MLFSTPPGKTGGVLLYIRRKCRKMPVLKLTLTWGTDTILKLKFVCGADRDYGA